MKEKKLKREMVKGVIVEKLEKYLGDIRFITDQMLTSLTQLTHFKQFSCMINSTHYFLLLINDWNEMVFIIFKKKTFKFALKLTFFPLSSSKLN